jgi:hypothetical protein
MGRRARTTAPCGSALPPCSSGGPRQVAPLICKLRRRKANCSKPRRPGDVSGKLRRLTAAEVLRPVTGCRRRDRRLMGVVTLVATAPGCQPAGRKTRDYPAGRDARHHISPEPPALGATNLDTDLREPGLGIQRQTVQPAAAVSERISPPRFVVVMEPAAGGPSSHADAMRDASSFQFNAGVE